MAETFEQKADRLYQFIHDHLKENAVAPSHREMYTYLQCSPNTLIMLLDYLTASDRGLHRIRGKGRRLWVPIHEMGEN